MLWINKAETEVLSPVGLEWLQTRKDIVCWDTCLLWFHFQIWEVCMATMECSHQWSGVPELQFPVVAKPLMASGYCNRRLSDAEDHPIGIICQKEWVGQRPVVVGESLIFPGVTVVEVPVLTSRDARSVMREHAVCLTVGKQDPELLWRWLCEVSVLFSLEVLLTIMCIVP